ncbi:MAG: PIN domain-containing protein [Anaerolineae bacterium]|nr:PIN domain-containing protein [Anaerolineae bacterium]
MFLVDTNVWVERLLDQEHSEEVGQFLDEVPPDALSITDFALHSICLVMCRLGQQEGLLRFVQDVFENGAVFLIHLGPEDIPHVVERMSQFNLDFDDAYQYVAAEKYGLTLVSFDANFDRTPLGRRTPGQILKDSGREP